MISPNMRDIGELIRQDFRKYQNMKCPPKPLDLVSSGDIKIVVNLNRYKLEEIRSGWITPVFIAHYSYVPADLSLEYLLFCDAHIKHFTMIPTELIPVETFRTDEGKLVVVRDPDLQDQQIIRLGRQLDTVRITVNGKGGIPKSRPIEYIRLCSDCISYLEKLSL